MSRHTKSQLTSDEVIRLLVDIGVEPYENSNFHVFYREYLNDSSWVLRIIQNDFLGNDSLGICEILTLKTHNVFVYGTGCDAKIDKNLISKDGGPFQVDGISFLLLVERRNNGLEYFHLRPRGKFEKSQIDADDSTIFQVN